VRAVLVALLARIVDLEARLNRHSEASMNIAAMRRKVAYFSPSP
jgi:BMFP domain-containing protein YqiC